MERIDCVRIFTGADGETHIEEQRIPLASNEYAPPAPPLGTSPPESAAACLFLELPAGWFGDWHPTPVRQWLFLMKGACEFETSDGARRRQQAGDAVLLEDTSGKGHRTRVVGEGPVIIAAVHLP